MERLLADLDAIEDRQRAGDIFERTVVPWLLNNAPEFREQFKRVWHWSEYPDSSDPDLGIDLG